MTTLVWPRFLTSEGAREIMPGMVLCLTVAMAATFLSTHYSAPVMLFALLLGMAFNFIDPAGKFIPGVALASRPVLRIGVAQLGAHHAFGHAGARTSPDFSEAWRQPSCWASASAGFWPPGRIRHSHRRCGRHLRRIGGAGADICPAQGRALHIRARHDFHRCRRDRAKYGRHDRLSCPGFIFWLR